jgi:plastocyanin
MPRLPLVALAIIALLALAACSSGAAPGWTYAPAASVTPAPSSSGSAEPSASASTPASASPSASASASPSPSSSTGPSGSPSEEPSGSAGATILTVTAPDGSATAGFDPKELEGPADAAFTVVFDNEDKTTGPHNWVLKDSTGAKVAVGGDTGFFSGPEKREFQIPALAAGAYPFVCEVHPTTMTGTLTLK